jgi:hypothetical protein
VRGNCLGQTAAFAADYDDGVAQGWKCMNVVAGEIAAKNGCCGRDSREGGGEVGGMELSGPETK